MLADLFGGRWGQAALGAASGTTEDVARNVGTRLMATYPTAIRALADMFADVQARASAASIAPAVVSATFNALRQR
jgi:hypothetical protein